MKKIILCASIVSVLTAVANAQNDITWLTPTTISGASDVSTLGTYFGSWAPNASSSLTVNGVTFQNSSDLPVFGTSFDNSTGTGSFASPGTADSNYNTLLTSGAFGNNDTPYTVNWAGMTLGDSYLVEVWVQDGRNSSVNSRAETITGGANTSASLAYGSGSSGPGQFIIGTFVAGTTNETIALNPGGSFSPSSQLNIMQVRDLGVEPTPEPSTLAVLAAGVGAIVFGLRRKIRTV
jgi:hypothetical protein